MRFFAARYIIHNQNVIFSFNFRCEIFWVPDGCFFIDVKLIKFAYKSTMKVNTVNETMFYVSIELGIVPFTHKYRQHTFEAISSIKIELSRN